MLTLSSFCQTDMQRRQAASTWCGISSLRRSTEASHTTFRVRLPSIINHLCSDSLVAKTYDEDQELVSLVGYVVLC
jgi:hypothetical protein